MNTTDIMRGREVGGEVSEAIKEKSKQTETISSL